MQRIQQLLEKFYSIANSPRVQLKRLTAEGKKVIGCFPYYTPEELVYAAGMIPFGVWGATGTVNAAKQYFPPFYCTIAQMGLELSLKGALDGLSGVIMSSMCDTLRPLTQNFQVANPDMPFMFLAHPQNRQPEYGISYTKSIYTDLKNRLEVISDVTISDRSINDAIRTCNMNRSARREFVVLAGKHPDVITTKTRCAVLKSSYFIEKSVHTTMLTELNQLLRRLPIPIWEGPKIVVSGIINDNADLLCVFDEYGYAITADDVAHESRGIRVDASEDGDPMTALAMQFAAQGQDPLLYDPELHSRPNHIIELVKESDAHGVVVLMMQFCDPEELEYPSLKRALEEADIPSVIIGTDQQMNDFGQAKTMLQAYKEFLTSRALP